MFHSRVKVHDRESGPLCLGFANTVHWHASATPYETLHSYADLVEWCAGKQAVSESHARTLLREAAHRPSEAQQALDEALDLREVIYRIFVAVIHHTPPPNADLAALNQKLMVMIQGARLVATPAGFEWEWSQNERALDSLLLPVLLSAAELLISDELERVGQCADDRGCGWLFLDASKNHSRRWCEINDCGNRDKQRRYHARQRAETRSAPRE